MKLLKRVMIICFVFAILSVLLFKHLKEPSDTRAIKGFYAKTKEDTEIVLGKTGWAYSSYRNVNFQIFQGKLYYNNREGDWICESDLGVDVVQEGGKMFWIYNNKLYSVRGNCLYEKNGKDDKELLLDNISEWGNIEVDKEWVYYYVEEDTKRYRLQGYNVRTKEVKQTTIQGSYCSDFWIMENNCIVTVAEDIKLYHLDDGEAKVHSLNTSTNLYHVAKLNDTMYLSITGVTEGDIFGKENVENDGVYRVDFEKMELEKISEETYDWIFANSDKLYGVKQKMWGLYSTIEEVKYNESKK